MSESWPQEKRALVVLLPSSDALSYHVSLELERENAPTSSLWSRMICEAQTLIHALD